MSEAPGAGAVPPAATAGETRRPLSLTVLLLVLFAIHALGFMRGLAARAEVMAGIPGFTPLLFSLWSAAQALFALGAIGLWLMQRWGFWAMALGWALAAFVDVSLRATGHAILVTGLFGLVVLFLNPVRAALK